MENKAVSVDLLYWDSHPTLRMGSEPPFRASKPFLNATSDESSDHRSDFSMRSTVLDAVRSLETAGDYHGVRPGSSRQTGASRCTSNLILDQGRRFAFSSHLHGCDHRRRGECGVRDQDNVDRSRLITSARCSLVRRYLSCLHGIGHANGTEAFDQDKPRLLTIDHELSHWHSSHKTYDRRGCFEPPG